MNRTVIAGVAAALAVTSFAAQAQEKQQLAFVVNAASDFWKLAEAGVEEGPGRAARLRAAVPLSRAGHGGAAERADGRPRRRRHRRDHDLVGRSEDLDRRLQPHRRAGAAVHHRLATRRQSNRIAYLGSSNTDAGVQAGEIAMKALPDGGKCMGFVGFLGADNAVERIAGFRQAVEGSGIELVDVRGDDVDFAKARARTSTTCWRPTPRSPAWSGFYSYNPPKIYEALQAAGKLGADHRHRLRRGPDHARRGPRRQLRRHRGAAALRVGLPGHEADGRLSRRRQVDDPGGRADHRADQGDRQGQRRRVRGRPEGQDRRARADAPAGAGRAPPPAGAVRAPEATHGRALPRAARASARSIPASSRSTASACRSRPAR